MNWKRILDPSELNWWTVISGMGMNFLLTSFLFLTVTTLAAQGAPEVVFTLAMSAGSFLAPLLTAYVCGRLSDERFLTYAFYPLVGFLILAVPGILYAGLFGLLTVGFGVLGAFNGATLAARRSAKRRRAIDEIRRIEDKEEKSV
jgi:hypothetical protein